MCFTPSLCLDTTENYVLEGISTSAVVMGRQKHRWGPPGLQRIAIASYWLRAISPLAKRIITMILKVNKLATLRRHASQVYFAKIPFE